MLYVLYGIPYCPSKILLFRKYVTLLVYVLIDLGASSVGV